MILSIDTLRSDHLPAYGYDGVATPALDAFAREAIRYERAYSHVPLTLPSHASIFTGRLPSEHGVRDNLGYALDPSRTPTLAMRLKERGYATGGFVSAWVLRKGSGIADGFDLYDDAVESATTPGEAQRSGFETLRRATAWLDTVKDRPFLLFVHAYEPHTPYEPPEPYRTTYTERPYDGEIAAADAVAGGLFEALRRAGAWDRAIVIVLSDHGEGLGEHGEDEHGVFVYRSTLQVPLLVKLPGGERGGTVDAVPTGLDEVDPTILDALGIEKGRSILDPSREALPIFSETSYPRLHFGWSDLASAIVGDRHWIEAPRPELYDLSADPGETRDLSLREEGGKAASFARAHRVPPEPPSPLDEEARAKLSSLGYLGGSSAAPEGDLADPKDRIADVAALREGLGLVRRRPARAVEILEPVVARNPRLVDAWEGLARAREATGDLPGSVEAWNRALEVSGGEPVFALGAAATLLRAGKIPDAEALAKIADDAGMPGAKELLARAALIGRRFDEAERLAREAVAEQPERFSPRIVLAQILLALRRPQEALAETDAVRDAYNSRIRKDPALLRGAALVRGRAYASLGDPARAIAAFEQEIEMFPDQATAYADLAVMQILAGDREAGRRTLERLRAVAPQKVFLAEVARVKAMVEKRP